MGTEKRQTGVELLRIVAMLMIVVMHFLSHSGNLSEPGTDRSFCTTIGTILENLCIGAVNAYVFISGYYGGSKAYKPGKALYFLFRIWFYALLIPIVLLLFHQPVRLKEGFYGILYYIFPIETEHYWFATSFLMLMLLTPFLNTAVNTLTKKQYQIALTGALLLFSIIKSVVPAAFGFDRYGYDLPWFLLVYLLAAYAGKYDTEGFFSHFRHSPQNAFCLYLLSAGLGMVIQFLMLSLGQLAVRLEGTCNYYFTVPYHYNTIYVLTGSIGLFYFFRNLHIKEGKRADRIRKISGLSFGVYLLHEHIDIRNRWYGWLKDLVNPDHAEGVLFFLAELVFCVVILFSLGIFVDLIRSKIFEASIRTLKKTGIGRAVQHWNDIFAVTIKQDEEGKYHGKGNE